MVWKPSEKTPLCALGVQAVFDRACARFGTRRLLMVGDQLETDVAGATAAGLDAALVENVSRWTPGRAGPTPTWLLAGLG